MLRGFQWWKDSRSLEFSRNDWHHWCIGSRKNADSKNQQSSPTHTMKSRWEQKSKQHTKDSCAERNRRGKVKPWLQTSSESSSSQHYNGNAGKSNYTAIWRWLSAQTILHCHMLSGVHYPRPQRTINLRREGPLSCTTYWEHIHDGQVGGA